MSDTPSTPVAAVAQTETAGQRLTPVAPYWHTALVVLLMLGVGIMSALAFKQRVEHADPLSLYVPTMIWLWGLSLVTYAGIRLRGHRARDIVGARWRSVDDALMDVAIAAGFWIAAMFVLVGFSYALMRLSGMPAPTTVPSELRALTPRGVPGMLMWIGLSVSAGICEEFVFRGYLQRQFGALTRNAALGILLPAAVFTVGHLYEGTQRAITIGVYGVMFGALAHFRRSLVPGMIAHTWHDIFSGLLLSLLSRMGR